MFPLFVIPAKAGIHLRTCRFDQQILGKTHVQGLDSRLRGNDESIEDRLVEGPFCFVLRQLEAFADCPKSPNASTH
jgi:hypothetical protein